MKTRCLFVVVVTAIAFTSCCFEVDCKQQNLNFGLISFTPADMDTIIFRMYEANSNFLSLKDTMEISNINLLTPGYSGDTVLFLTSNYASSYIKFQLRAGNDYEIFIPGASKLTRITEIREEKTSEKVCFVSDGNHDCYNPIISYKVDGQSKNSEFFFIHKKA